MSDRTVLYDVLESKVNAIADFFDDTEPYHIFSRRYFKKENMIRKAYLASKQKHNNVDQEYRRISLRNKIKIALIIATAILCLAGFTIYVTHYIGNMKVNEYDKYSLAYAVDTANTYDIIKDEYSITYDLSEWEKEILSDDNTSYWEIYRSKEKYFSFEYAVKSTYSNVRINSENSEIENRNIGGYEAIYYSLHDGTNCLIWDNGDYIFEVDYSGITYEQALVVIESIKLTE